MAIHHDNDEFKHNTVYKIILLPVEIRPDGQIYVKIALKGAYFQYERLSQSATIADYLRKGFLVCLKV